MITSAQEFVRLRTSESQEDYARAADEEAPLAVWINVVSQFPDMCRWVAHNQTVPVEILELLAFDADPLVRAAVAAKRKLSAGLFEALARDSNEVVRQRVAYNEKAPRCILERLANDPVELVRSAALRQLAARGP